MTLVETLCQEFKLAPWQVEAVISLLDGEAHHPLSPITQGLSSLDDTVFAGAQASGLSQPAGRQEEISSLPEKLESRTEELRLPWTMLPPWAAGGYLPSYG